MNESTEITVLDATLALRLLREVVAERPDYVCENPENNAKGSSVYTDNGKPSCLIGHVLYRAGFDIETIAHLDGEGMIPAAAEETALPLTDDAVTVLYAAQAVQDNHRPWAEALAAAEERARELGVPA